MSNSRKGAGSAAPPFAAGDEVRSPAQMKRYIGYAIRRAQLRVYENFFAALKDLDTTPTRFTLMLLIRENPGIRSVDLARTLDVARSAMVKLINDLEQRDLIVRVTLQNDRRNQALDLTALGRRKLTQMERATERHEAQITSQLSAAERKRLIDMLWRVAT